MKLLPSKLLGLVAVGILAVSVTPIASAQSAVSGLDADKTSLALARAPFLNGAPAELAHVSTLGDASVAVAADPTPEPMIVPVIKPFIKKEQQVVSPGQVHLWQALVLSQHSAAFFDAWSTRKALTSGNGYERNPLLRPFAQSATIYPATQAVPFALDFLSYRMMRSKHPLLRRTWWLPQAVSIAGSAWCGTRNMRVANLQR
jgi:hypothetical protein